MYTKDQHIFEIYLHMTPHYTKIWGIVTFVGGGKGGGRRGTMCHFKESSYANFLFKIGTILTTITTITIITKRIASKSHHCRRKRPFMLFCLLSTMGKVPWLLVGSNWGRIKFSNCLFILQVPWVHHCRTLTVERWPCL